MYAIALLQGMVFYGPIATLYRQARGITVFDITFIESISYLLCIILEIPWGIIADKIGYKKTMVFCSGLYFVSKLIFWRADSFGWFLLERVLLSVVCAGISGVDISILYLSAKKDESQKVFGVYNGLGTAGLLCGALTFAVLIQDNYDLAALLTVLSYGLAMILSLFLTEVKKSERSVLAFSEFNHLLKQSIKNKWALIFLLMVAIVTQTHQTVTVFLNQIQYEKCGMSASLIGYVYIVVVVGGILGYHPDDERIRDSFRYAEEAGIEISFEENFTDKEVFPNTVDIYLTGEDGDSMSLRGESSGGGNAVITRLNGVEVELTGNYCTMVVQHVDKKGTLAFVTTVLSAYDLNIGSLRLYRESRGKIAYAIIELDANVPEQVVNALKGIDAVINVLLVPAIHLD